MIKITSAQYALMMLNQCELALENYLLEKGWGKTEQFYYHINVNQGTQPFDLRNALNKQVEYEKIQTQTTKI